MLNNNNFLSPLNQNNLENEITPFNSNISNKSSNNFSFNSDNNNNNINILSIVENNLKQYKCFITEQKEINFISKIIYYDENFYPFFYINNIDINILKNLIKNSKILSFSNFTCLYKEGSEIKDYYILIKGGIIVKKKKSFNNYEINLNEILNEYYLKNQINNNNNNNENFNLKFNNNNNNNKEKKIKHLKKKLNFLTSPKNHIKSTIFFSSSQKIFLYKRIRSSNLKEENEIFKYQINNNNNNNFLIFGNNLFNINQNNNNFFFHKTSAYIYYENNNNNNNNNNETILLYINNNYLKEINKLILKSEKQKQKFLQNHFEILNNLNENQFYDFYNKFKLLYFPSYSKITLNNNNNNNKFYLIYIGECVNKNKKEIIYSKGDFIFLENIFNKNKNNDFEFYSTFKSLVLFEINLNKFSNEVQNEFIKFLKPIFIKQKIIRKKFKFKFDSVNLLNTEKNQTEKKDYFKDFYLFKNKTFSNNNKKQIFHKENKSSILLHKIENYKNKNNKINNNNNLKKKIKSKINKNFLKDFDKYLNNNSKNQSKIIKNNNNNNEEDNISRNLLSFSIFCDKSTNYTNNNSNINIKINNNNNKKTFKNIPSLKIIKDTKNIIFDNKKFSKTERENYHNNKEKIIFEIIDKNVINCNVDKNNDFYYNKIYLDTIESYSNKKTPKKIKTSEQKINDIIKIWKKTVNNNEYKFPTKRFKIPLLFRFTKKIIKNNN